MSDTIEIVKEKRKNIFFLFLCSLIFLLVFYLILDKAIGRIETSISSIKDQYKPLVDIFNNTLISSGKGIEKLSNSGVQVLNKAAVEIPRISEAISDSVKELRSDYAELKSELTVLRKDIREDISWLKLEIKKWRRLVVLISVIIGLIAILTSINDILANLKWLLSLISSEKKPRKKD